MSAVAVPAVRQARPRLLTGRWPLHALFLSFPLAWVLGLAGFVWFLAAVPMTLSLLRTRRIAVPRGFGVWLYFLAWMLLTAVQVDVPERMVGFAYRAVAYTSATVWFLYVFTRGPRGLPAHRLVASATVFGAVVVAGGWLAVLAPALSFASPVERLLGAGLVSNPFVYELVHPASAVVQDFLGYPIARPKAPFPYANDWGAAMGLLLPFVLLAALRGRSFGLRALAVATLVLSVVPMVVSLNRALWGSIALVGSYILVRLALRGRSRAPLVAVLVLALAVAGASQTPLRGLVADRLATPHSNSARGAIIAATLEETWQSPWLGYGAPRPFGDRPLLPSLGTQGHLWLVPFSHGLIGGGLFLLPLMGAVWRTRRWRSPTGLASHASLLVACCALPFYDFLPSGLHLVAVAAALGLRELPPGRRPPPQVASAAAEPQDRLPVSAGERWLLELLWRPGVHRFLAIGSRAPEGWEPVALFGVMPLLRSRPLVPLFPPPVAAAVLRRFHHGTPGHVRAAKSATATGLRLGLLQPLVRDRVQVLRRRGATGDAIDLHLAEVLGYDDQVVVAPSFGPLRFNQKPVLQILSRAGATLAYAKVGCNPVTRRLVDQEARFLAEAPGLPLRLVRVPRLLHRGTWHGLDVLVMSALPVDARQGERAPLPEAAAEVAGLRGLATARLAGSAYLATVRGRTAGNELLERVLDAVEREHGDAHLTFGGWHGDWGPWNMSWQGNVLCVWDWERTRGPVPLGFDPLHFCFQEARLGRGVPPVEAGSLALRDAAGPLRELGVPDDLHRSLFLLYAVELVLRELDDRRLLEADGDLGEPRVAEVLRAHLDGAR